MSRDILKQFYSTKEDTMRRQELCMWATLGVAIFAGVYLATVTGGNMGELITSPSGWYIVTPVAIGVILLTTLAVYVGSVSAMRFGSELEWARAMGYRALTDFPPFLAGFGVALSVGYLSSLFLSIVGCAQLIAVFAVCGSIPVVIVMSVNLASVFTVRHE